MSTTHYRPSNKAAAIVVFFIFLLTVVNPYLLSSSYVYGAKGNNGAIWTTRADCGTEQQDVNHYNRGEDVYINGRGFDSNENISWEISGQPGHASADPNITVASGSITADAQGNFCFKAYTVQQDDEGEYKVKVGSKGDNYRVEVGVNAPTPTQTVTPSPTLTFIPTITLTPTPTEMLTVTPTETLTMTPTLTGSITPTMTITPTISITPTLTITPTSTPDPSVTTTITPTLTQTPTPTTSITPTSVPGPTATPQPGPTATPGPGPTATPGSPNNGGGGNGGGNNGGGSNGSSGSGSSSTFQNPVALGVINSTLPEVLGEEENNNPLIDGIRGSFGEVLGASTLPSKNNKKTKQLPKTGEVAKKVTKLPSSNKVKKNTYLYIPKIGLHKPVYHASKIGSEFVVGDQEILEINSKNKKVLYGHNTYNNFGSLGMMYEGDTIIYTENGVSKSYQVKSMKWVSENDTSVLESANNHSLILMTCDLNDFSQRIIIEAVEVEHAI